MTQENSDSEKGSENGTRKLLKLEISQRASNLYKNIRSTMEKRFMVFLNDKIIIPVIVTIIGCVISSCLIMHYDEQRRSIDEMKKTEEAIGVYFSQGDNYYERGEKGEYECYQDACREYRKIINVSNDIPDNFSRQKAMAQYKLGDSLKRLAEKQNKEMNLRNAIEAYNQSLKYFTNNETPCYYAMVTSNCGGAYSGLSELEAKEENLLRAIENYDEAIRAYESLMSNDTENYSINYAINRNNRGNSYINLAKVRDEKNNTEFAIIDHKSALNIFTGNKNCTQYLAILENNLGWEYLTLSEFEDEKTNIKKAIRCFENASTYLTCEKNPFEYMLIQNSLGEAYLALSEFENKENNIWEAIIAFNKAEGFFGKDHPINDYIQDYGQTQRNLGSAYCLLAEVQDKESNTRKAIDYYNKSLKIFTFVDYPIDYATTQNELGNAYLCLSKSENKEENVRKAIIAHRIALDIFAESEYPVEYARTQKDLGDTYCTLAEVRNPIMNLNAAIEAYEESLKIEDIKDYPRYFAEMQESLGDAYFALALAENDVEYRKTNLNEAIEAYGQASRVRPPEKYPEMSERIQPKIEASRKALKSC
ncbi:hypothetical protein ACSAZK_03545 [Methanosarcina sp. Mfa9]|uniref:hypothetical protein n=1 Tax=Methanosarcina sp. Mfa9 TaxID=3439063 RepID=UPI003F87CF54